MVGRRWQDVLGTRDRFDTGSGQAWLYRLTHLEAQGLGDPSRLPYSLRVLLESVVRHCDGRLVTQDDVTRLLNWNPQDVSAEEIPFLPARVILQDFTGVPAIVDLAAMRSAMKRLGGSPSRINPLVPADLVVDHSIQVDAFGTPEALEANLQREFQRNAERYEFLRWGQESLDNFRVIPPNVGIVHQVNLEYLARTVFLRDDGGQMVAIPDTLVGTDSHTTMINGLGVVGWGVGGIEAEAVMLGQPVYMLLPEIVGMELSGELPPGTTATDLVLTVTERLRAHGVVGKFVEFFGEGVTTMSLPDRATLANMAPEYGATMGFFPIDDETIGYLRRTGRPAEEVQLAERYAKEQLLFRGANDPTPGYCDVVKLDLSTIEPSLAGPKRPQDRVPLAAMKQSFQSSLTRSPTERGFGLTEGQLDAEAPLEDDPRIRLKHGAVVIAAITSCTNTSNPSVMLAAGLLAKKAVERGLSVPPYVKTSLAPGSRVVTDYFRETGLDQPLEQLGFHTVGYGCTTCIGNSGPLPPAVAQAVQQAELVAAAVLSGNRNFEGRVNPLVKANYLASPPLVVAYALAGTVTKDLTTEPLGKDSQGQEVYLHDIWPGGDEIRALLESAVRPELFVSQYETAIADNERWNRIEVTAGDLYQWNPSSSYIQEPPFLAEMTRHPAPIRPLQQARVLCLLGDSVTTDHISPAGAIPQDSPAGRYLIEQGVDPREFNSYGSRRGNDRVMVRGTFANIRLRNLLAPGTEGGWTRHLPSGEQMSIYDAAMRYREEGVPLIVLAGKEYGTGSSRDWAAKGTYLLGVRAVIAASFERIHRSNLVGMGVLPLEFLPGETWQSLGLTGEETYDIPSLSDELQPRQLVRVRAVGASATIEFDARVRVDTPVEMDYYRNGGILQTVIRQLLEQDQ